MRAAFGSCVGALAIACAHHPGEPPRQAPPVAAAQPKPPARLADSQKALAGILAPVLAEDPKRAVGVILLDGNESVALGFGPRNASDPRPMDSETTFEVGSVAKTMLGVLLADAIQRGEVGLDDPVERHLPDDVRLSEELRPATLRHLATLTTGFPIFPGNWVGVDWGLRRTRYTLDAFKQYLKTFEPAEPPGRSFKYSAIDTALLAIALAHRAGMTFPALLKKRLFEPLGMKRSEYVDRLQSDANRLDGYDGDGAISLPRVDDSPMGPCCAIRSTLGDMTRYLRAAMGGKSPLQSAFARSQKPLFSLDPDGANHVALGWQTNARWGSISKNGQVAGYRSNLVLLPAERRAVFVVVNSEAVNIDALGQRIVAFGGRSPLLPRGLVDHRSFVVETLPADVTPVAARFSSVIRLEGIRVPSCVRPGETMSASFFFRSLERVDRDFRIFVHAEAGSGSAERLRADHFPNGGKGSTLQWQPTDLIRDDFSLRVPSDYPAHEIALWTGLFDAGGRLEVSSESGEVKDNRFRGPIVKVGKCD